MQWALAYLAVAWVLVQVLGAVGDAFGWPRLIEQAAFVMLAIGLAGVLVLAWYHGEQGRQTVSGLELLILTSLCLVAGALVFALARNHDADSDASSRTVQPGSVAVLPFENLSVAESDAYFAAGMHDELLTQLSKLSALKVISRTSVMQYEETTKSLQEIGEELGVAAVLRASVQRAADRVQVRAQLIDADTDEYLWADTYDRQLDDVFAIQTDLAIQIATALNASLSAREQAAVELRPTQNNEAHDAYLRAGSYFRRPTRLSSDYVAAQQLYERAVQLDPQFALAYAALAEVHAWLYWNGYDRTRERGEQTRMAAERALQLQPDLVESHLAMGLYHYRVLRDYENAIAEFQIALRDAPGDSEVILQLASVKRRQGLLAESARDMERAHALDPRNPTIPYELGTTYTLLHDYPRAMRAFDRAIGLAPDHVYAIELRALAHLAATGTTQSAAVAVRHPGFADRMHSIDLLGLARVLRDTALMRRTADAMPAELSRQTDYLTRDLGQAWASRMRGDSAGARAAYLRARAFLDNLPAKDERHYIALGHALAGLGLRAEARQAVRQGLSIKPPDAVFDVQYAQAAAEIFAQAGDVEAAIPELQRLLAGPSFISAHTLRIDPFYDSIRNDPRFQKLLN